MKKQLRVLVSVLATVLMLCLMTACSEIGTGDVGGGLTGLTYEQSEVLRLVNIERENAGLRPLEMADTNLIAAAQERAQEISNKFSHTRPNGSSCFTALDEHNVRYSYCGENIAAGQQTPEAVVNSWMNSPGHRANILNPNYRKIGIGYCYSLNGGYSHYWVQMFTN